MDQLLFVAKLVDINPIFVILCEPWIIYGILTFKNVTF